MQWTDKQPCEWQLVVLVLGSELRSCGRIGPDPIVRDDHY